ncbi:MAG: sugar ABC transporter permease [Clostridia bacterium]|nr:sugar ABC transporter permease [Clostridia bacterium]MBQ4158183.1 sugar ABC transporter permease [Clostridia bacterium]
MKRKNSLLRFKDNLIAHYPLYLMVIPALLYYILFVYKPMYGILIAFEKFKMKEGILGSAWVGFDNFERLMSSYWFPIILKNTLMLSALSLLISFPLPIVLSLMVNELNDGKGKKLFQTVSYAPHFISTVVVCGMLILFMSPSSGILGKMLSMNTLAEPSAFKWLYVLSGVWQGLGWSTVIYFAALSGVDKQLLEAAEIDGANRIQRIIHINFPVLVPTITVLLILQMGQLLNVGYEKVYLLQNDANLTASEVISTYVYKLGLEQNDFSFSTAASLFNSLVNCVILVTANTLSRRITHAGLW